MKHIFKEMKEMKTLKKTAMSAKRLMLMGMLVLMGTAMTYAEETNVTNDVDTTYIKLDENMEPINFVNSTKEELEAAVGELETILETENFQLYAAGDYTYKIENGVVTSMAIQIADDNNDKVRQLLSVCQFPGAVR